MKTLLLILLLSLCHQSYSQIEEKIIEFPDIEAQFPGGYAAMRKYISENIVLPTCLAAKSRVYVSFLVNIDGSLTEIKIERGINEQIDNSVIKLIEGMPHWIPAEDQGIKIVSRIRLPFSFGPN